MNQSVSGFVRNIFPDLGMENFRVLSIHGLSVSMRTNSSSPS